MNNKVISFSLWGNDLKYTVGAIKNAELTRLFYKDWKLKYYIANTVPNQIIYHLEEFENVEIIEKNNPGNWTAMFWRFDATHDDDSDVVIFRDTDSRFSAREEEAVEEWLSGDKTFHIMRDHPFHKFPILGGMWGMKKNNKYNMKTMLDNFIKTQAKDKYGTDYEFLQQILYPMIKEDVCVHDEFFSSNCPFPSPRNGLEFVGEVLDENDNNVKEHEEALRETLK